MSVAERVSRMIDVVTVGRDDVSARIEISGRGDDLDALAEAINTTMARLGERVTRAEAAMEARAERYRRLEATVPGMVYTAAATPDGRHVFLSVTAASRELFDIEPAALVRDGTLLSRLVHPDDRERLEESIRSCTASLRPWREEVRFVVHAEVRWYDCLARPQRQPDGRVLWDGIILEITDRKRKEQALRLAQFSVDRAPMEIYCIGADAQILSANEQACRNLGYTREELSALTVFDVDPTCTRGQWRERQTSVRAPGGRTFESVHRRKDNTTYPVEITVDLLEFQGRAFAFAYAADLSERKRAEDERRNLEAQVQQAQKLGTLGILAGGIAHDFNNLLMVILGNADLALEDMSPVSPARPMIEEIERTARRAADLCTQMLAYSGKGRREVRSIDLSEVVREMGQMLEVSVSKKALLRYQLPDGLPAVQADPTQMRQVIMNLIINASEAIGDQGGVITVSVGAMHCDADYLRESRLDDQLSAGPHVYVEVGDTGCGMDSATLSQVFDPFFTTKLTGRGLGLAAVQGIVRAHKGAIKVYSEPGTGTTFKVMLPALGAEATRGPAADADGGRWRGSGTVLLADDDAMVLQLGKHMLERLGFSVLLAADGREALETYRERGATIRCVVLDLTMPEMGGEQAFRELRRIDPSVRVVLSSGYGEADVVSRFAGKGLAGFVQKPYKVTELARVMRTVTES